MVTCQDDIGLGQLELTVALMSPLHQLRAQRDIDHLRRHGSIVCAVGGTASGITGVHEWLFNETPTGTHVTTNESFAGDPATLTPPACERGSTLRWQPGWITSRRPPSQRPDTSPTALPPHRRHHPHPRPDRHPSAFHRRTYSAVLRSADISRHGRPLVGRPHPPLRLRLTKAGPSRCVRIGVSWLRRHAPSPHRPACAHCRPG